MEKQHEVSSKTLITASSHCPALQILGSMQRNSKQNLKEFCTKKKKSCVHSCAHSGIPYNSHWWKKPVYADMDGQIEGMITYPQRNIIEPLKEKKPCHTLQQDEF